jgi:hypothetical protein
MVWWVVLVKEHWKLLLFLWLAVLLLIVEPGSAISQLSSYTNDTSLAGANMITVVGDIAYITSWSNNSLTLVNISNTSAPSPISQLQNDTSLVHAYAVVVQNNTAYVIASNSLTLVNVSNPANPVQISSFINSTSITNGVGLAVVDNIAYVTGASSAALTLVNVSNPANPVQISSFINSTSLGGAAGVRVSGGIAYIAAGGAHALTLVNVSNPANPVQISSFINSTSMGTTQDLDVQNNIAYVIGYTSNSLAIVNVSNPANPVQISSFINSTSLGGAFSIVIANSVAYITGLDSSTTTAINVSNPANPVQINSLVNITSMSCVTGIAIEEEVNRTIGYVTANCGNALTILQLTEPSLNVDLSISAPIVRTGKVNATISWNSNIPANITLHYGNSTNLGTTVTNVSFSMTHLMQITGLERNTTYFYNVTSCDSGTSCLMNGTFNFTTGVSTVILLSPSNNSVSSNGTVAFQFNVTDTDPIASCSLLYQSGVTYTSATGFTNATLSNITISSITNSHPLAGTPMDWQITCSDVYGVSSTSDKFYVTTVVAYQTAPPSGPGGSGGTVLSVVNTTGNLSFVPEEEGSDEQLFDRDLKQMMILLAFGIILVAWLIKRK